MNTAVNNIKKKYFKIFDLSSRRKFDVHVNNKKFYCQNYSKRPLDVSCFLQKVRCGLRVLVSPTDLHN